MRWRPPRAWLRVSHAAHANAVAAVGCAIETETGDRWLMAVGDDDDWIAVRNVCATSYRGDGLRLRMVVRGHAYARSTSSPADEHVQVFHDGEPRAPYGEWSVRRESEVLIVQRMEPALTVKISVGPISPA